MMINVGLGAWGWLFLFILMSSAVGLCISSRLPWRVELLNTRLPFALGLALAPFVLGLTTIAVLQVGVGEELNFLIAKIRGEAVFVKSGGDVSSLLGFQVVVAHFFLYGVSAIFWRHKFSTVHFSSRWRECGWLELIAFILLSLWCVMLLVNALYLPLTQNDSLEYALVGRVLFESGSLDSYPVLSSLDTSSGFYGPWTHPPLYVSLISLLFTVQDDAAAPGLMRLLSPWACIVSTYLFFSLTGRVRCITGLLSALFFISTPLYFLGGDSSLIDAFPILGVLLVLVACSCFDLKSKYVGAAVGAVTGVALWTHSQSVLLLPIFSAIIFLMLAIEYQRKVKPILWQSCLFLAVALFVGGAWYLKNIQLFGSPISDNPVVFAMPNLDWFGYFTTARGLNTWPAIIQYGWFKGWFALEAYGLSFWLMSIGLVVYIKSSRVAGDIAGLFNASKHCGVLWVSAAVIAIYTAIVLISTLLGMDLMIKNERYLLFILPAVAVWAGFAMNSILELCLSASEQKGFRQVAAKLGVVVIIFVALVQFITVAGVYRWRNYQNLEDRVAVHITHRTQELLAKANFSTVPDIDVPVGVGSKLPFWSNLRLVNWINDYTPADAVVFSLRPSDMFYSTRRMLSYLDPVLEDVYLTADVDTAYRELVRLGVTHIQTTNYSLPVQYNSVLKDLFADPKYTELEYYDQGNQLLKLRTLPLSVSLESKILDITPGKVHWTRVERTILGGRKGFAGVGVDANPFSSGGISNSSPPLGFFHRDTSTMLYSGLGENAVDALNRSFTPVGSGEYLVDLKVSGYGFARIYIAEYDAAGDLILDRRDRTGMYRLDELVLEYMGEPLASRRIAKRVVFNKQTKFIRLAIEHVGRSNLELLDVSLVSLSEAE